MQQALDALKVMRPGCFAETTLKAADTSIVALRDRLAQSERQWVGLTNQERNHIWRNFIGWGDPSHDDENLMKAIEAKIKEKNDR